MIFETPEDSTRKKPKVHESDLSSDDIWASDDDNGNGVNRQIEDEDFYGQRPSKDENSEISALRRIHAKQGYLDGISAKKEETLQEGFDAGYPTGAEIGRRVGQILLDLYILSSSPNSSDRAKQLLVDAKTSLHIKKILNSKYFNDDLSNNGTDSVLENWENTIKSLYSEQINS